MRLIVIAAAFAFAAAPAVAQDYPTRPVTIVVPAAAGGPTDTIARITAQGLSKVMGQQLRLPVILAPIGSLQDFATGGGITPTLAAARFGVLHMLSSACAPGLEAVAQSVDYPKIYQLYVRGDAAWVEDHIARAIANTS